MDDSEIERIIRQAGYELQWERGADGPRSVFALRDGKRHTRGFDTLLALAEHLGRIDRPVRFIDDAAALNTAVTKHSEVAGHFAVRLTACRVAVFNGLKFVQLVDASGDVTAMYELRPDAVRRTSSGNMPPEVVAAFQTPPKHSLLLSR
jgi:hypothetical protein